MHIVDIKLNKQIERWTNEQLDTCIDNNRYRIKILVKTDRYIYIIQVCRQKETDLYFKTNRYFDRQIFRGIDSLMDRYQDRYIF